ncbi:MAG: zinc ribbon domain-containing protein [Akkermansiaceae bacterium]|nr:zinc ribbon domain-containing protein [Akkermansiaceae bacterium]MCF7733817.1 zinc ribbon domain-containing protein [Akkermansiaceae bacterium]
MSEVSALRKHPCPDCGGDAEWNAAKQALACPYCGTVLPWSEGQDPLGAPIAEHDLIQALAKTADAPGGPASEKRAVKCESCQAISQFDADRTAQRCDFCGSPSIVPAEALKDSVTPESLLPAAIPEPTVRDQLRTWYRSRWFAPNKLKRSALTDTLHGVYLPYWTFDAKVDATWTAESGYHYYVTEQVRGADGKTQSRQVQKTRWEHSAGALSHFFDDDLVPGTVGVHTTLLRKVEPFPTLKDLKPYDPAYIRGWTVERYQVDLRQAATLSQGQMDNVIHQLCARDVPGDTHRNLQVSSTYQGRTFKHILVPIWLVSYTYGPKSFQVVVNGYTGKMAGEHPLSWVKITFAVLAALALIILLFVLFNQ